MTGAFTFWLYFSQVLSKVGILATSHLGKWSIHPIQIPLIVNFCLKWRKSDQFAHFSLPEKCSKRGVRHTPKSHFFENDQMVTFWTENDPKRGRFGSFFLTFLTEPSGKSASGTKNSEKSPFLARKVVISVTTARIAGSGHPGCRTTARMPGSMHPGCDPTARMHGSGPTCDQGGWGGGRPSGFPGIRIQGRVWYPLPPHPVPPPGTQIPVPTTTRYQATYTRYHSPPCPGTTASTTVPQPPRCPNWTFRGQKTTPLLRRAGQKMSPTLRSRELSSEPRNEAVRIVLGESVNRSSRQRNPGTDSRLRSRIGHLRCAPVSFNSHYKTFA